LSEFLHKTTKTNSSEPLEKTSKTRQAKQEKSTLKVKFLITIFLLVNGLISINELSNPVMTKYPLEDP